MDIKTLSLEQLESLGFREINRLNMVQSNLKAIYAEIERKQFIPQNHQPKKDKKAKK
jgi:hypothetical protein